MLPTILDVTPLLKARSETVEASKIEYRSSVVPELNDPNKNATISSTEEDMGAGLLNNSNAKRRPIKR